MDSFTETYKGELVMWKRSLNRRKFLETTSVGVTASVVPSLRAATGNPNALAVQGGTPVRSKPFPAWPQTRELDENNILRALRSHRWCTYDGEFIRKFETAWAQHQDARGCVMTPCGTHALHMALEVLDVQPGDEVLVAPFSFIADVASIMLCYALPVFVDTDLKTFQMDPDDIERRITEHTRAIMPCHILGAPPDMDRILAIARKHNIPVVEDAAQAHTTQWKGKKAGTIGTLGCFSFQETKVLPGGEAGAMTSNDEELIAKGYCFRDWGRPPKRGETFVTRGTKYRISEFAAAILMAQITHFEDTCLIREKNAAYLNAELRKVPGIMPQEFYPGTERSSYYNFGLRFGKAQFCGISQDVLIKALTAEGIPVSSSTPPLNREPYLERQLSGRGYQRIFSQERLARYREQNVLPRNDELCETHLVMPHEVLMGSKADTDDVVEAFAKVQKHASRLSSAG
jgi:perosamine synthetase